MALNIYLWESTMKQIIMKCIMNGKFKTSYLKSTQNT